MATATPIYPLDTHRILRRREVERLLGISSSLLYAKLDPANKYFDPEFPVQISLGGNSVGWKYAELIKWIESRLPAKDVV